jgi:hypothetical protein
MPAKLNIEKARSNGRFERASSPQDRNRPMRAASTASRGYSQQTNNNQYRGRRGAEEDDEGYADELYDMYQGGGGSSGGGDGARGSRGQGGGARRNQNPRYIEEEDEGSDYDDGSFDENDFEIVSGRRGNSVAGSSRGMSRRPEMRQIRVKVHAGDVRYVMIGLAIEFPDLQAKIRDKFGLRRRFKIKVRDDDAPDSDMITMGDQDDLEMVIMGVKSMAKRQRQDIGKMEVSTCVLLPNLCYVTSMLT